MQTCRLVLTACLLVLVAQDSLQAQFYAPETDYHDKAQRLFPVEAVRVLAWRENLRGSNICEVTYTVTNSESRITSWKLNWLDKDGKPLKQLSVSYPESLLNEGPDFYRQVVRQLRTQAGSPVSDGLKAREMADRFWAGAELAGSAREEGLRVAFKLASTNTPANEPLVAPGMAGLLIHDTLPSLCGGLTLDATLLARGAAWLALSESTMASSETAPAELWAPVLFLAGREPAACKLWREKVSAGGNAEGRPTLYAWWNCFLRRPPAREAFIFATSPTQQRFGMPIMTYYSRIAYLGTPFSDLLYDLYGRRSRNLLKFHNYGWFFSASTDIGGGRLLEGAWPAVAREEWRKTLDEFTPSRLDYTNYEATLKTVSAKLSAEQEEQDDASLAGLEAFAPLLQMGYEQGTGKLIPTGVATARDLLNYGWEMNGMQMGARYHFVANQWGVRDLADTIFKRATRDLEGQAPFFPGEQQKTVYNLQQTLWRLQMVDDLAWRVHADAQPFAKDTSDAAAARVFHLRCWMRPYYSRWQGWALARAGLTSEIVPFLKRYHEECGLKADALILEFMKDCCSEKDFETVQGLRQLRTDIAKAMIDPTDVSIHALYDNELANMYSEERGQKFEEMFWRNPDCGLEHQVMICYINGGAWKSARRFYKQVREVVSRDVDFSNMMAPDAWALGFLSGDEELMRLALKDSNTGSQMAMWTHIWNAAAHDDLDAAEAGLDEMIDRYESESGPQSPPRFIKGFLPLIPALKNPKSPEHEVALDYFGKSNAGVVLRWVLIKKYKIPPLEAVRFLGGKETDRMRRVLVLSILEDKEHMFDAIVDFQKNSANSFAGRVVAQWVARQTLPQPTRIEEKDLRPPGAQSLQQAVRAALAK